MPSSGTTWSAEVNVGLYWGNEGGTPLGSPIAQQTARAVGESGPFEILARDLGAPPAGATHLLLIADRDDVIPAPADIPGNNQVNLLLFQLPNVTVQLIPESPEKGLAYTVDVDVKNNSLVAETFTVDWSELYAFLSGFSDKPIKEPMQVRLVYSRHRPGLHQLQDPRTVHSQVGLDSAKESRLGRVVILQEQRRPAFRQPGRHPDKARQRQRLTQTAVRVRERDLGICRPRARLLR